MSGIYSIEVFFQGGGSLETDPMELSHDDFVALSHDLNGHSFSVGNRITVFNAANIQYWQFIRHEESTVA